MYGAFPYGSVPYGASGGVEPFDYEAMLAESRSELVYTVEIEVWNLGDALIDRTTGTNIGDLTGNAGLAAAFNGVTSAGVGASAARGGSIGYVGKTLAVPSAIDRVVVHGPNDYGYAFATNAATTISLYGKVGAAPSSATNGTLIGSIAFTDTSNESVGREIDCTDKSTMYDHVWVVISAPSEGTAVYCAELVMYRNRLSTVRLGSAEWATAPTDVPNSTPFDGRLTTVLQWSRSIVGNRIGVDYTSGEATIAFLNSDGEYDDIVDGYSVDGRSVVVRVGRKTDAFANHLVIFRGVGVDWTADDDAVTITARDKSFLLDVPAQPNVYAGTGGAEGGEDLAGKRKPLAHGIAISIAPVLVDTTNLIYQLHDGALELITGVYDRGVLLTKATDRANYAALVAAAVAAGQYDTCLAEGLFKLGAAASGIVLGAVFTSGVVTASNLSTDSVVADFLSSSAGLSDDDIDHTSFDVVSITNGDPVCHFVGQSDAWSVADVVTTLMAGVGGWAGFNRDGKLSIGILTAPSGDPVASFARDEGDIIDLNREKLPSGVWPPPWRWRVAWDRRWTTFDDFAGVVSALLVSRFAQPYALVAAEDTGILVDHPSAQDPAPIEAYFQWSLLQNYAEDEAERLLALYSSGYKLYRITLGRRALALNLGDLIFVTWPRFGLDAGKLLRVIAIDDRIDLADGSGVETIEVTGFG